MPVAAGAWLAGAPPTAGLPSASQFSSITNSFLTPFNVQAHLDWRIGDSELQVMAALTALFGGLDGCKFSDFIA